MQIAITTDAGQPVILLYGADDFTSFKVVAAPDLPDGELSRALTRLGRRADGDHVLVSVDAIKTLAGSRAEDQDWQAGLDSMLAYAQSKGWIDGNGYVRAHIESA
jgi:hypothetical protein